MIAPRCRLRVRVAHRVRAEVLKGGGAEAGRRRKGTGPANTIKAEAEAEVGAGPEAETGTEDIHTTDPLGARPEAGPGAEVVIGEKGAGAATETEETETEAGVETRKVGTGEKGAGAATKKEGAEAGVETSLLLQVREDLPTTRFSSSMTIKTGATQLQYRINNSQRDIYIYK